MSYLHGKRLKLASASGQVVTLNTKDFNAGVSLNDTDSRVNVGDPAKFNELLGRLAAPSGQGYALDAGLVLRHRDSGARVELAVADLAGRMNWRDVPNNVTHYSNATKYYDANGYVQFNPSTTRTSSYQNLSQKLDPKLWLAASYPVGNFEVQGATSYTRGYWLPQAGVSYRLNPQWRLKAEYDLRFHTLMLAQRQENEIDRRVRRTHDNSRPFFHPCQIRERQCGQDDIAPVIACHTRHRADCPTYA